MQRHRRSPAFRPPLWSAQASLAPGLSAKALLLLLPQSQRDRCLALPVSQGLVWLELHIKWPESDKQWLQLLFRTEEGVGNHGEFSRVLTAISSGTAPKASGRAQFSPRGGAEKPVSVP